MEQKAGVKTTEFWVTLIIQIVAILGMTGALTPDAATGISQAIPQIVGGIMSAVSGGIYIYGRVKTKTSGSGNNTSISSG
jgi:hypothetical protein